MLSEKVVKLNQDDVGEQIQRFIQTAGLNSEATGKSYQKDIRRFFEIVKDKDIKFLTKEDLKLSLDDFEDFVHYLQNNKVNGIDLNAKTINHNVSAVAELMRYLASKKDANEEPYVKDISYITQLKRVKLKENKNSHGALYKDEVEKMALLALEERHNGEIKNRLIKFAFDTLVRKEACLNVKWTDFSKKGDEYLIKGVDKGNKDFKVKISKEFYNQLLEIKSDSEFVFSISESSVDKMMDRLRDKMRIRPERNIVFHSLRKGGAILLYKKTGDIRKVQAALNHSNINTTIIYLEDENEGELGSISSGDFNTEIYKDITHEELLKAIELLPQSAKFNLALKIKEVVIS